MWTWRISDRNRKGKESGWGREKNKKTEDRGAAAAAAAAATCAKAGKVMVSWVEQQKEI